jgi:hypothetical protein
LPVNHIASRIGQGTGAVAKTLAAGV